MGRISFRSASQIRNGVGKELVGSSVIDTCVHETDSRRDR